MGAEDLDVAQFALLVDREGDPHGAGGGTLVFAEPMTLRIFAAIVMIIGAVTLLVAADSVSALGRNLSNKIRNKTFKR